MRYLVLFFMIMGLRGGLFAQVATPMYGITREAMQVPVIHDTMRLITRGSMQAYVTGDAVIQIKARIDTINCCPAYVMRHPDQKYYQGQLLYFNEADPGPQLQPIAPIPAIEFNTNAIPLKWGLGFISGAARGLNQTIAFHPDRFFSRYPNADRRFWDNSVSWRNKWRNGDPEQGEAFLGSSTVFVWTTDALHLSGTISNVTGVASLSIPLYKGCGKMNLWRHLAQVGITSAGYWLGFHSVYSWWFQ
jgi:hypothetical protein